MFNTTINIFQEENINKGEYSKDIDSFFSSSCNFLIGTTDFNLFPKTNIPEIAFIGRSNVGKSSMLNAIVNRKSLARVSVTPGRTQQVNFFSLNNQILLVDLPGYGFAKAPKNLVKSWERMSLGYLKNSVNLKKLFLLIDSRHGFKDSDINFMMQLKKHGISYQIILTKVDKTNKEAIEKIITYIKNNLSDHPSLMPILILSSSKTNLGIDEIRAQIFQII